jgi:hypothetical protein
MLRNNKPFLVAFNLTGQPVIHGTTSKILGSTRKFLAQPGNSWFNQEGRNFLALPVRSKSLEPRTETVTRNPLKSLPRNRNKNSCFGKFLVSA